MSQCAYICACEWTEYALSRWWGAASYVAACAIALWWGWDWIDRFIYITTALIVLLLASNERRSQRAMHIKLDEIDPRPDHNALERRDEREMSKG